MAKIDFASIWKGLRNPVPADYRPARPELPPEDPARWIAGPLKKLNSGRMSRAWSNGTWVVKIPKTVVPEDDTMLAQDDAKRSASIAHSVNVVNTLREDRTFPWRKAMPQTFSPHPLVMIQAHASGKHRGELHGMEGARAEREKRDMQAEAKARWPEVSHFDIGDGNMFFDARGRVVSWFDPAGGAFIKHWSPGLPLGLRREDYEALRARDADRFEDESASAA